MGCDANRRWKEAHGAPPAALRAGSGGALNSARTYRSLLAGAIDYAGLFPPASLDMAGAVAEYAGHRKAPDRWALGRFVVPLTRWDELVAHGSAVPRGDTPWPVSVLAAPADGDRVLALAGGDARFEIQSVESRAATPVEAARIAALAASGFEVYVEPMQLADFDAIAPSLIGTGAAGKIRTGGVTADAFPTADAILRFMRTCRNADVRFKATAGLHHAVRGEYRLTYEPSPPTGEMFGFLNVAVGAALLWFGHDDQVVLRALEERSQDAFEFPDAGLSWRGEHLSAQQLAEVRARFFAGFGSCSFREPMSELGLAAVPSQ